MSIVYLKPEDFYVSPGNDLATRIPKFSLVFFSSASCIYCKEIMPVFLSVTSAIKGCTFAIMDVNQGGMRVVKMAEGTKTPIRYVPHVIMYANGIPIAIFDPDDDPAANYEMLKQFIIDNAAMVRSGRTPSAVTTKNVSNKVCDTSIGMAICGSKLCGSKRICYLNYESAYGM